MFSKLIHKIKIIKFCKNNIEDEEEEKEGYG